MILPGQDLEYGFKTKSAIPLIFQLAPYPVFLAPRCEGKVNIVFIEDVSKDCIVGAFEMAKPAEADETGTKWHTIVQSVGHSNVTSMMLFRGVAPEIPRFDIRTEKLRTWVRNMENMLIRLVFGGRKAKLLATAYETYDYFMANTWAFEPKYTPDVWKVAVGGGWKYHCARRREQGLLRDPYFWFWAIGLIVLSVIVKLAWSK